MMQSAMNDSMMTRNSVKKDATMNKVPFRILQSILLAVVLLLSLAGTALADTVTLVPDGVVSTGGWTGVTVGNLSDGAGGAGGGDGTFATITGTVDTFNVSISNDAAYSGATINAVTAWVRASVVGGSGAGEKITFGSSAPTVLTSAGTNLSDDPTRDNFNLALTNITTSGDIDALEISVNTDTIGAGEEARIFEVWVVVDYTPLAAQNEINSCNGCHGEPPIEAATRNATGNGEVVGSHSAHTAYTCTVCHPNNVVLNHRGAGSGDTSGSIDMLSSIQGGFYDENGDTINNDSTGFAQDNDINGTGLGSCRDVACHGGASSVTPQWGGASLNCDGCHGAPPATDAHATHYTAKGWGATDTSGTYCVQCHPDNTAGHSDVTDGTIIVNAGLTPSGTSPAISCGSAPTLGCHNGKATPNWDTTGITCQQCHTAGGADTADPVSGLHDETPTVSGVLHHPSNANFTGCEDCHTATPSVTHYDATFDTPSTFAAMVNYSAGSPPTCTATCHVETGTSGPWARPWHENSDQNTGTECAGCHGDWVNGWNGGVTHRTDTGAGSVYAMHSTGTTYECTDCHAIEAATGYTFTIGVNDWGGTSNHGNGVITLNSNGTTWGRSGGLSGCAACHAAYDGIDGASNQHSFTQTGWTSETVSGDTINAGCDTCHGGGGEYWPKGASYPDTAGEHQIHITRLAAQLSITLPGSDAQQKQMCDYCHNDAAGSGGGGHNDDVYPADVGGFNKIWDATSDATATYTPASQTCAIACHNGKTTAAGTFGWNDAGTSTCTMCHTVGGGVANEIINPTTGLHDVTPTISGVTHDDTLDAAGCAICHTTTPSSAHIDGVGDTSSPTITVAGSSGFSDGSPPSCANTCHSDGAAWNRLWHENATAAVSPTSLACAGCHGTFTTEFNTGVSARHQTTASGDPGGQIASNHDGTDACVTCHAYDGADTYGHQWATHHMDNKVQISDQANFTDNGATVGCSACHASADGTADGKHEFTDASAANGWSTTSRLVAGPTASCTACHSGHGTGAAGIGPDSPHSNNTAAGGGVYTCEGCHTSHSGGTIVIPNNTTVGINFTSNGETGINLGGSQTSGTTEAQICWNCHDSHGVSEWNKTWGGYQTGTLSVSNWTTGSWASANFAYKTDGTDGSSGTIQSTHTADAAGGAGVDPVDEIRCSYCHDVHDNNLLGSDSYSGDTNSDGVYEQTPLRGSWTSNPFPEDGAPQTTAHATVFGGVPRAGLGAGFLGDSPNAIGGWQIEQNNPTAYTRTGSYAGHSQLCSLCHVQGDLETAFTGHAAAVDGFSGTGAQDVFNVIRRGGTTSYLRANMQHQAVTDTNNGSYVYGLRESRAGGGIAPQTPGDPKIENMQATGDWATMTIDTADPGTPDANFHQFPCSKCHNPHASRLPKLMITNCLDVRHNKWDDTQGDPSTWGQAGNTYTAKQLAYSPTAVNCHRFVGGGDTNAETNAGTEDGWNGVTPW